MRSLSKSKEVIINIVVENINIGLASRKINDGKKWFKRSLRQVDSRPKIFHVELATESMEKETHPITEVMKGEYVNI